MSTTTTTDEAERIVGALRAHEAELRRGGIRHLSLFGSFARGDAGRPATLILPPNLILPRAWTCSG